jgi:hypothetical protein
MPPRARQAWHMRSWTATRRAAPVAEVAPPNVLETGQQWSTVDNDALQRPKQRGFSGTHEPVQRRLAERGVETLRMGRISMCSMALAAHRGASVTRRSLAVPGSRSVNPPGLRHHPSSGRERSTA